MNANPPGCKLRAWLALALPSAKSEQGALEAVLDALAPVFEGTPAVDGERTGALLVMTEDAGSATAVQFWRDALAVGPALASPGAFPWCLANAPCGTLARRFVVTGPNITWLAPRSDAGAAFDAPAAWLAEHLLSAPAQGDAAQAWLVALRFGAPAARVLVWHWLASGVPTGVEPGNAMTQAALRDRMARDWTAPL